jgi:putative membrane protein
MQVLDRARLRDHVPLLTAVLTIVSLALIFGAVLGYIPASVLVHNDALVAAIPHLNALISAAAIATILVGVRAIRAGDVERHRRAMVTTTLLFAGFLALYLYRVSLEGPTSFQGPAVVEQYVYYPMLGIHILLAMICVPFVYYALLLGGTHPVEQIPHTSHKRVGRIAATLWLISFSLGIGVYLQLHLLF